MTRILRGLTSERLTCGCLRGVYETYDGRVVAVFDALGEECRQPGHVGGRLEEMPGRRAAAHDEARTA